MGQMTSFIIAMIIVSLFVTVLTVSMQDMTTNYNITYDNQSMTSIAKFNELGNLTNDIQESGTKFSQQSGVTDILGSIFSNGYKVLLLTTSSLDIFRSMIDIGFQNIGLGGLGQVFKTSLMSILIIVVIMGIIIGAVLKLKGGF